MPTAETNLESESNLPPSPGNASSRTALLCFAHLRWNFVYQRPQHLLRRAAGHADVFFFEEPVFDEVAEPVLRAETQADGVQVLTPVLPHGSMHGDLFAIQRQLLDRWLQARGLKEFIAWYYTPMALLFTDHLSPAVTIYDCMDQLSAFQGAPPELIEQERRLFEKADVVFTGGRSLFEEKRGEHSNLHLFPSSVDRAHFAAGREAQPDPEDQAAIPHPRIGFFGVIDERLDRELLHQAAEREPGWQFIMIGPVVKISPDELPRAANLHYLGQKQYSELPQYLANWDVAMLPFALNASTRFISPTKTPEYLAAGKPVVSTPVRDVAEPYERLGLARIAATAEEFCDAIAEALEPAGEDWLPSVDEFLRHTSWDQTFERMWHEVMRIKTSGIANYPSEEVMDV
jgi:glycosyltransferase involved in cell wall biosynthesis